MSSPNCAIPATREQRRFLLSKRPHISAANFLPIILLPFVNPAKTPKSIPNWKRTITEQRTGWAKKTCSIGRRKRKGRQQQQQKASLDRESPKTTTDAGSTRGSGKIAETHFKNHILIWVYSYFQPKKTAPLDFGPPIAEWEDEELVDEDNERQQDGDDTTSLEQQVGESPFWTQSIAPGKYYARVPGSSFKFSIFNKNQKSCIQWILKLWSAINKQS
jgi:hypothetical protein